jgi:hypothetical protein
MFARTVHILGIWLRCTAFSYFLNVDVSTVPSLGQQSAGMQPRRLPARFGFVGSDACEGTVAYAPAPVEDPFGRVYVLCVADIVSFRANARIVPQVKRMKGRT